MANSPELPQEVQAAREFFKREHDPKDMPFAGLGDNRDGMILYIPGPLPAANLHVLLATISDCLERPDMYAQRLHDRSRR